MTSQVLPEMPKGALWSSSNPRPDKDIESRIFWNKWMLVAAVPIARGYIAKKGVNFFSDRSQSDMPVTFESF